MRNDQLHDGDEDSGVSGAGRPWVGIFFECCGIYSRIYRQPDRMYYSGRCPKCLREVHLRVGEDGTDARLFRAW